MVQLNPGNSVKEPAVFLFRDTKTRNNNPAGAVYVNTERGYEVPESQLAQVSYQVYFRNSIKLEDVTFDLSLIHISTERARMRKTGTEGSHWSPKITRISSGAAKKRNAASGNPMNASSRTTRR